jgi:Ni/Co efflux regulator RcnB
MNRLILLAALTATVTAATAASAQTRYEQQQQQYQQAVRQNQQEQRDYRHAVRRWEHGQTLPMSYRSNRYIVNDYSHRGWRRPPAGYAYYNTDSGDVVLAAIASGVISSIVVDNNRRDYRHR